MKTRISERYFRVARDYRLYRRKTLLTPEQLSLDVQAFLDSGHLVEVIAQGVTGEADLIDGFKGFSRIKRKNAHARL